jgi:hypothetical protein
VFRRDARSVKAAVLYGMFGTFCLYLHATGVLFVAACGGAVWLSLLTHCAIGRRALLPWTATNTSSRNTASTACMPAPETISPPSGYIHD